MNRQITKKISSDTSYKKVGKSYQDNLSPDEIKEKLEEYKPVYDISTVPINSHIIYFIFDPKTNKKQFRLGGFLTKIEKEYIVLSNGTLSWSVQKKTAVFYQKMSLQEIKQELVSQISKTMNKKLEQLKEENRLLKQTLKDVKKTVRKSSK
jgi:hypothetical protein